MSVVASAALAVACGLVIGWYFTQTPQWHPPIHGPCIVSSETHSGYCDNGDRRF